MNWRQAVMNWSLAASWFEICDFMNWIALFLQCRRQFMPPRLRGSNSWRKPIHAHRAIHCTSVHPRDNKKCPTVWSIFCKLRPKVELISWRFSNTVWYREYRGNTCDIVDLSCVFVRYREYREYHRIKCCTKFAPKSHQRLTPIQLDKLEFVSITTALSHLQS